MEDRAGDDKRTARSLALAVGMVQDWEPRLGSDAQETQKNYSPSMWMLLLLPSRHVYRPQLPKSSVCWMNENEWMAIALRGRYLPILRSNASLLNLRCIIPRILGKFLFIISSFDLNCSFTGRINFEVNVLASDWQEDRRSDQEDRTEGVLTSWKLQSRDGNSISSAASWLVKILRLLVY